MFVLHPRPTSSTVSNSVLSEEARALVDQLTLEEKISLLTARDFSSSRDIPRLNIPSLKTADSTSAVKGASLGNPLPTACFPNTAALAASWDRDLLFEMGKAVAGQARFKAAQIVLGPTVNIHRHPFGGRNFEAFSEDPVLTGQLAAALVNGIQTTGMAACVKHFVCNDSDTARKKYSSEVDERTLRELYLAPFQWVIREANPAVLMSAYNKINGTYCCETPLYKEVVQKEWGFRGSWMSDWYGTESTVAAVEAGLDIEMPGPSKARGRKLLDAADKGLVSKDVIDQRVIGILKMIQRTREVHSSAAEQAGFDEATNTLIRKIASESVVLLKNEQNTLPLKDVSKIAVIGEHAVTYAGGGGSASGLPQYYKSPLNSLKAAYPESDQVIFSPGVRVHRCIPMAAPPVLTNRKGGRGVDIAYYAKTSDGQSKEIHREEKPVPIVFILGHLPEGLDEKEGFTYEITTTITPKTTGMHTIAVLTTGAISLSIDETEVLSRPEPRMTVEDFLFVPQELEQRCSVQMEAGKGYFVKLVASSRRELNVDEPTPHSSKICLLEEYSDDLAIETAGKAAEKADFSVVFAGRNAEWESEGSDLTTLHLPNRQDDLIKHVASKSKKTIVVLFGGNPFDVSDWINDVDAILFAHFPGQEGGEAIADIITGKICPSGRLSASWPHAVDDVPSNRNFPCMDGGNGLEVKYAEGLKVGYRHFWSQDAHTGQSAAMWDFGFGLSYTSFSLSGLEVKEATESDENILTVGVTLQNIGQVSGAEVVQVYVEDVESSVWRPIKELKGFEKVFLQPGEKKTIAIAMLKRYALSFWDDTVRQWKAEEGEFRVHVGDQVVSYTLAQGFTWTGV